MAIPLLLGGLAQNAKDAQQEKSISNALAKDHSGSVIDDLSVVLSDVKQQEGAKIVDHILGTKTVVASKVIGSRTQIDPVQVQQILSVVAPVVMGALGNKQKSGGLGGMNLSDYLQKTVNDINKGPVHQGDFLAQILDQNKNGSVVNDIVSMGLKLLGRLFKK